MTAAPATPRRRRRPALVVAPLWYVARAWALAERRHTGPASVAHAKQAGTALTACGASALSWVKEPDVAFPPRSGQVCDRCVAVVRGGA